MSLENFSDEQLREELKARTQAKEAAELKKRQENNSRVLANIDILLLLTEHQLMNCRDDYKHHDICIKCWLLKSKA